MSIYKDSKTKNYYFSVRVNGKQYVRRGFKSKAECSEAERKFIADMSDDRDNPLLMDAYEHWVEISKSTFKPLSLERYNAFKNNYLSKIENKRISDLTPREVQEFKANVLSTDNTLLYKKRWINIMLSFLQYCSTSYRVKAGLADCLYEPLKDATIKELDNREKWLKREIWEQMLDKLDYKDDEQFYYYVILSILYNEGMRVGELAALNVSDYYNREYIYVNKDYIKIRSQDFIQPPKTDNSVRKVFLTEESIALLDEYIRRFNPNGVLFGKDNKYLNEQQLRKVLLKISKEFDKIYEIKIHNLRHSCACNLRFVEGWTEIDIAAKLGHKPEVTASVYLHSDDDRQRELSKKIRA